MNLRLLIRPMLALSLVPRASCQIICNGSDESVQYPRAVANFIVPIAIRDCDRGSVRTSDPWVVKPQSVTDIPTRTEVLRRIAAYQTAFRAPEAAYASVATVAKAYARLASLYKDAAMPYQAEAALEHAISLLRGHEELSGQLAESIDSLGLLHAATGKSRRAEREELEALRLRENLGDSLGIARSWNALSGLYFKERKYAISRDLARKALDEFSRNKEADVADRISSRFNLSIALCYTKECPSAIPLLKDTVTIAKLAFKPTDFPVGEAEFLLGFSYWKSGDIAGASESMEQGVAIMKEQLGWGHPAYLNALGHYAQFLRENRRVEDAEFVERQIRQAESVVDVHSIQARKDVDSLSSLR
jgi:tetratricopeptide (TPR) repeat protein